MTRRILAIIIAIVLAALGTAGVLFYVLTADARAREPRSRPRDGGHRGQAHPGGTTGARSGPTRWSGW